MNFKHQYIGRLVPAGLFLVLLVVSCADFFDGKKNSALLTVYLTHGFENDTVRLSVNNEILLDSVITTANVIDSPGVMAQRRIRLGYHTIKLELPEQDMRGSFSLHVAAEVGTVWVEYRRDKKKFRWKADRILVWLI